MGCFQSSTAQRPQPVEAPKPITLGPAATTAVTVPAAASAAAPVTLGHSVQTAPLPADAAVATAAGAATASAGPSAAVGQAAQQALPVAAVVAPLPLAAAAVAAPAGTVLAPAATNPAAVSNTGPMGMLAGLTVPRNLDEMKTLGQKAKEVTIDSVGQLKDQLQTSVQAQMETALVSSDNKRINSILDSAMAGSALGNNAPDAMRRAANQVAARQLKEAIASEDPKQLKGALVAAKRLNATEVPEFHMAVDKYKQVKKLPAGWDVKNMVLQRVGDKMVAKMDVGDAAVQAKFQRLLDLTHRKVYTRDRLGEPVPDRLELVSVTTITNEDLWGDYMVKRETMRREIAGDPSDFLPHTVDTQAPGDTEPSAASIVRSLAEDFAEPLLPELNEVFLFHGTSAAAADAITTGNFKVNLAGSNAGTLYGRGVYLAENASKSDEYTRPDPNDLRYLILSRVLLGRAYYTDAKETDPRQCEETCLRGKYHSVLGDRKKCRGTFREFVVFDEDQVYANYIMAYRRVNPVVVPKQSMMVQCPPACPSGTLVQVQTPDGVTVQVLVPPGIAAGQQFMVQY